MKVTIITIGDELLIGETVDTNSAWIAQQFDILGVKVHEIISVSDDKEHIKDALKRATDAADIVLMTGGLGPTNDDITKHTLAEYFGVEMRFVEDIYTLLKNFFEKRYPKFLEQNKGLADLPANAEVIINKLGTSAGMWFDENSTVYVSMPGVPHEMKGMMEESILPRIKERFKLPVIKHRYILTAGVAESYLADKLISFEADLPVGVKLAYLPGVGSVRLRLSAVGKTEEALEELLDIQQSKVSNVLGKHIFGYGKDRLPEVLGSLLLGKGKTIATAESCTGGYIAHSITQVPGSSKYFKGSVVAYANEVKEGVLGVKEETLKQHGAVSEEVVQEMAAGALRVLNTDYAIAVSGIAGPGGGTKDKPVGTVWIAYGGVGDIRTKLIFFPGDRARVIGVTSVIALNLMRRYLKDPIG